MRRETDRAKLESFMEKLGQRGSSPGRIYLTGEATALLHGWRTTTIDIDLKAEPEPAELFEAIAQLKEELDVNVELESPDDFIPPLPDWQARSVSIGRHGKIDFFHYDFYGQALSKLERRHDRDLADVEALAARGLIDKLRVRDMFEQIAPKLIRYPAVDATAFRAAVVEFCDERH